MTVTPTICPECRGKGRTVAERTVQAMLTSDQATASCRVEHSCCNADDTGESDSPSSSAEGKWRFCDSPDCDVVYFSLQDGAIITRQQLNVSIGVKETDGKRQLCYCFGHSIASIKEELLAKGRSDALSDIRTKMKDPGCRCETTNPSGRCCLGSVAKGIKIAQQELGIGESAIHSVSPTEPPSHTGARIASTGTILSALMASSCCWLPLILLALGVSGAGIASALEAYRPILIIVTFGFLAAAFYFTYRPRKTATAGAHSCCSGESNRDDACCGTTPRRWLSAPSLNKLMLWWVTAMAFAFLLFPSYVGALFRADDTSAITSDMNRTTIQVDGMTCDGCAVTVAQAIRSIPGVQGVVVSYEKRQAIVGTLPSQSIPTDRIITALERAGYEGHPIAAPQPPLTP